MVTLRFFLLTVGENQENEFSLTYRKQGPLSYKDNRNEGHMMLASAMPCVSISLGGHWAAGGVGGNLKDMSKTKKFQSIRAINHDQGS
jgi:hypothetical protein